VYYDLLSQWAKGKNFGGLTGTEAREILINEMTERMKKTGEIADVAKIDSFFNDLPSGIIKLNPEWKDYFKDGGFTPILDLVKTIGEEKKLDEDSQKFIYRNVSKTIVDMIGDLGLGTYSTEQWIQKARDMSRLAAGMVVDNLKVTNDREPTVANLEGANAGKNKLDLYIALEAHPELRRLNAAGDQGGLINESTFEVIQKQALKDIEAVLDETPENLEAGWEQERDNDITAIPVVIVKHGENQGRYKYQASADQKTLNLMRYDDETKKWDIIRQGAAEQTLQADLSLNAAAARIQENNRRIENLSRPAPNTPLGRNVEGLTEEDFYIAGKKPDGTPLKEVPYGVAESIRKKAVENKGRYYGQWEAITQRWQDLGISIGEKPPTLFDAIKKFLQGIGRIYEQGKLPRLDE
jgi:hypothetical protein